MLFLQVRTKYLLLSLSKEQQKKHFRPLLLLNNLKYKNNFLLSTNSYSKTKIRVPKQPSSEKLMGTNT